MDVVEQRVRARLWRDAAPSAWLDDQLAGARSRARRTPFAVADALLARSANLLTRTTDDLDARFHGAPAGATDEQRRARALARRSRRVARALRQGRAARHRVHELGRRSRAALHGARRRPANLPTRSAFRAPIRSRAASTRPAIAASSGRCASSPASAARADTNARYKFLLEHGQTGLSVGVRFPDADGLRLRPSALARAKSASAASRSRASPTWRRCSTASRSTRSRRR